MSQTKAQLLEPTGVFTLTNQLVGVGATFSGDVSIGGTLTKQDVTNIDSVGVITARDDINIVTDNKKLNIGAGADLQLYHENSGNNSLIFNKTGDFYIQGNNGSGAAQTQIQIHSNGKVDIKYQGNSKLETSSGGVKVTGKLGIGVDPASFFHLRTSTNHNLEFEESSGNLRISALNDARSANEVLQFAASEFNFLTGNATFAGSVQLPAVAGTNTNTLLPVLFQTAAGVIEGGSGLQYNPGGDTLNINGVQITQAGINGHASSLSLAAANHSSTCKIIVGSTVAITGNTASTGIIADRLGGDVRRAIQNTKTSAYTLVETDTGKHINISSGGVTVPNNVLVAGAMITIVNNSGSDQTITQGSGVTLYNSSDASTGNRTLAGRGMATILFTSGSIAYISGPGLS